MRALTLFGLLGLAACGGTERKRITFPVEVSGKSAPLVTDSGWSVTLTRATLHLEALRFFEGKVLLAQRAPWWRGLVVSEAWAHPGHYLPGEALGELVATADLDLLAAAPTALGVAEGVTAEYGSAQLTLAATGLELEGTATKDAQAVPFSTAFMPPAALEGLRFDHRMTTSPGVVQVVVDLAVVLSRVDFAQVGAGAKPLDVTSPAFNGVGRGVEDTSAYVITWKED